MAYNDDGLPANFQSTSLSAAFDLICHIIVFFRHIVVCISNHPRISNCSRQVYHTHTGVKRFTHERANNSYEVLPAFFADITTAAVSLAFYIPIVPIPYYMMGLPTEAFPFVGFALWMVSNISDNNCA